MYNNTTKNASNEYLSELHLQINNISKYLKNVIVNNIEDMIST